MLITICMSMALRQRLPAVCAELESYGHSVLTPVDTMDFDYEGADEEERAALKRRRDLIRLHYQKISRSDAILVLNEDLPGRPAYIGGNSFLEMGFAHVLELPIYVMQDLPASPYRSEMLAMDPIVLDGDLSQIAAKLDQAETGGG